MKGKVLRWGSGYGIRLTKADAEREGLVPGQDVEIEVRPLFTKPPAPSTWPSFDLGGLADRHDDMDRV